MLKLNLVCQDQSKLFTQGRNEVRWRLGQEVSLVPHVQNRSFGSKCSVLKMVLLTLLGLFGVPCSNSVPPR